MSSQTALRSVAASLLVVTAAFGTAHAADPTAAPEKHIVFLSNNAPDTATNKAYSAVVQQYQEQVNPNFTVEMQYVPSMQAFKQKIKTLIASDAMPDMFNMDTDPFASQLLKQGLLKDITEFAQRTNLADLYYDAPFKWGAFADGTQAGIPQGNYIEMFWFNKALFEQAGVEPPTTLDGLLDTCEALKAAGITPISLGGKEPWTVIRYLTMHTFRAEGNDYVNGMVRGDRKWAEPTGTDAATFVNELGTNGCFQTGYATYDLTAAQDYFLGGNAAIFYTGTWALDAFQESALNDQMKGNVDYFLLPVSDGGATQANEYIAHGGTPFMFGAKNWDPAMEDFVQFFAEHYGQELAKYTVSPNKDVQMTDVTPLTQRVLDDMAAERGVVRLIDVDADPATNELMNKEVVSLTLGELSVDQFVKDMDESIAKNAPAYFQ